MRGTTSAQSSCQQQQMLRIDDIDDLATAKRVAQLLEKENKQLHDGLHGLVLELAAARGQEGAEQYAVEVVRLQERIADLNRRLFARRRASFSTNLMSRLRTSQLELKEEFHDIADDARMCELCGNELREWEGQSDDTSEITVVQRSFILHKHIHKKYNCKCGAAPVTASGPLRMPGGGLYSIDFAIDVAFTKYGLRLPLQRQVRWMMQQGLDMGSLTPWDQIEKLAQVLSLSYGALRQHVLSSEVIHGDETRWRMLTKGAKLWWAWCIGRVTTRCTIKSSRRVVWSSGRVGDVARLPRHIDG